MPFAWHESVLIPVAMLKPLVCKWIASFVTLAAPPDPGQLKEQPFPLVQEYCHSNATSDMPGV
jgi:hypothetical protein